MSSKEYQKKSGYAAQKKYAANNYSNITITVYKQRKQELETLAHSNGVSMSKLVINALSAQYQIDFSKPNMPELTGENENA